METKKHTYYPNKSKIGLNVKMIEYYRNNELYKTRHYDENGNLLSIIEWKNGKYHGRYISFYMGRQIKNYRNGILHGKFIYYDCNDKIIEICNYKNNTKHGTEIRKISKIINNEYETCKEYKFYKEGEVLIYSIICISKNLYKSYYKGSKKCMDIHKIIQTCTNKIKSDKRKILNKFLYKVLVECIESYL
jgi:antitoxin component YwqK of YwqJK toxin-antitoxin module